MSEGKSWKTPAAILGIIGALVAIGGLYLQHQESVLGKHKQIIQEKIDQANSKKEEEINKQKQERLNQLNIQLKDVESQIKKNDTELKKTQHWVDYYGNKLQDP